MKKIVLIALLLIFPVSVFAASPYVLGVVGVVASGESCSETATISVSESGADGWEPYGSDIATSKVPNSVSKKICKISLFLYGSYAGSVNLDVRSTYNGGGTKYGATATATKPSTDGVWVDFAWSSDYPELSGDLHINTWVSGGSAALYYAYVSASGYSFTLGAFTPTDNLTQPVKIFLME